MNAIENLRKRLSPQPDVSVIAIRCAEPLRELRKLNAQMEQRIKNPVNKDIPPDKIREALRRFWSSLSFEEFRVAERVCAGLALPLEESGPSVLDDWKHLRAALDGLQPWRGKPRLFRRCFYGLMHNYFACNLDNPPNQDRAQNWRTLRDYLRETSGEILEAERLNPDWAHCLQEHVRLFNAVPCAYYADKILAGDSTVLNPLREQLHISQASWFWRELVLSQIDEAAKRQDDKFKGFLDVLLEELEKNELLRDRGLAKLLERYVRISGQPLHPGLRDAAISWWRNPWLPSNAAQWGGVSEAARDMVAGWLKREFVEEFFRILAEDGNADTRRAKFWLCYVKTMGDVRFALGDAWRYSHNRDVKVLLEKMEGSYTSMDVSSGSAFIMTLGDVVVVEFGQYSNAVYAYRRENVPFNWNKPVTTPVNRASVNRFNSLKNSENLFTLRHVDGLDRWEDKFEERLRQYGVSPDATVVTRKPDNPRSRPGPTPTPATKPPSFSPTVSTAPTQPPVRTPPPVPGAEAFSIDKLRQLAREKNFRIEDRTADGGYIWAYPDIKTSSYNLVLRQLYSWGFRIKDNKGWWLKP